MSDARVVTYDNDPGDFVDKGEFGDPAVTPKPLRIAKSEDLPNSDSVASKSFPCSSHLESQHSLVPVRRSSLSVDLSRSDLSQQDLASLTPHLKDHLPEGSNWLNVRKQRLSDPGCSIVTSSAPTHSDGSQLLPAHTGICEQRASIMIGGGTGMTPDEVKASMSTRSAPTRAFTTGAFDKTNFLSPINDEPLISPAPLVALTDRQRAVTTNAESHNPTQTTKTKYDCAPRRQASFKNRLMIRMMSGFPHRDHNGGTTSDEKHWTSQMLPQKMQPPIYRPRHQLLGHARQETSSRTDTCFGSDLDIALSAFPTPPTSNDTSPTTNSSRQSSIPESPPLRILHKPETSAIMGPQLEVTPEYGEVNSKNRETMQVAIDIRGSLNATTSGQSIQNTEVGLDVVVIVDNSFYASTSTLMASCEIARSFAWTLNVGLDRMAILCTSAPHNADFDATIMRPLSQPSITGITRALDKISATTNIQSNTTSAWKRAIKQAKIILLRSKVPRTTTEGLQDVFGHIFLLTANAEGLPLSMLCDDMLRFHVICAGTLARENNRPIVCNGWTLRSISGSELRSVNAKNDTDPTSLFNRLRALIMHARGGKLEGQVSDLVLDIIPGEGYEIASEMGSRTYSTLNLGQLSTVLVNLKFRTSNAQGNAMHYGPSQSATTINGNNVWTQLDQMLGLSEVRLVTARLRYKHSLLPEGTTCSVSADCFLKLKSPDANTNKRGSRKPLLVPTESTALVHKRWAYHIATHNRPKVALSVLRSIFGESGTRSSSPGYLKLLSDELKHQARIIERLELDTPKKAARSVNELVQDDTLAEQFGQLHTAVEKPRGGVLGENQKPENWITVAVDDAVSSDGSGADLLPRRRQLAEGDKARRILGSVDKAAGGSPGRAGFVGRSLRTRSRSFYRELERRKLGVGAKESLRGVGSGAEGLGGGVGSMVGM